MRIIDFHTHIYPPAIAEKAAQSISDFYSIPGHGMVATSDFLIERGKQAGIEQFVVLPVAIKADHARSINNFILEECAKHSEFFGFGTVHAEMDNILQEAEYILNNGLYGVKMHPDTQRFNIDDERLFPLYDYLQDKLPVLLHCGDEKYDYSRPERVRRIIDMFPRLQVIAAHLGGYTMWDDAAAALGNTNCYLDISSSLMFMQEEQIKKYIKVYGCDRLLYGTDFPIWDPAEEVDRFMKLDITDNEREKIAYKNAEIILNIK